MVKRRYGDDGRNFVWARGEKNFRPIDKWPAVSGYGNISHTRFRTLRKVREKEYSTQNGRESFLPLILRRVYGSATFTPS